MAEAALSILLKAKDVSGAGFSSFKKKISGLTTGLGALKAATAAVAGAAGLGYLATQAIKSADQIGKAADKIGISTDALQEYRYAAELAGVGNQALDTSLQRFSRRLGEAAQGTGELLPVLKDYGIAIRNADGSTRSTVDVLKDYADVIANAESEQEQLRIAVKGFDTEGAALVNLFREGSGAIDRYAKEAHELGVVMDEDMIDNATAANDAITKLSKVLDTQFKTALVALAPLIESVATQLTEFAKVTAGVFDRVRGHFARVELIHKSIRGEVTLTREEIDKLADSDAIKALAEGTFNVYDIDAGYRGPETTKTQKAGVQTETVRKKAAEARQQYEAYHREMENWVDEIAEMVETKKREADEALLQSQVDFMAALQTTTPLEQALLDPDKYFGELKEFEKAFEDTAETAGKALGDAFGDPFRDFIEGTKDASDAFQQFTANVISDIGRMVSEALGEAAGSAAGDFVASLFHGGGQVGMAGGQQRSVSPLMFAAAPRLHSGLAADEFPAILQRGEQVIPRGQGAGADTINVNITTLDSQTMAQFVRRNRRLFAEAVSTEVQQNGPSRGMLKRML